MALIIVLLAIGLLVFVHEFGHFIVAKLVGMKVEEFAFGFPPTIWSKKTKETKFSINLFPVGGYVKILGEDGKSTGPRSFASKRVLARLAVIVAGVLMNFILGAILLSFGFMIGTLPVVTPPQDFAGTKEPIIAVASVLPQSPAQEAELKSGERIIGANIDKKWVNFASTKEVSEFTKTHQNQTVVLKIGKIGKGEQRQVIVELGNGETPLGVSLVETAIIKLSPLQALVAGTREAGRATKAIVGFFGKTVSGLFHGQASLDGVAGPVGIYNITVDAIHMGWTFLIQLVAVLSINLAVLNILPFPALDGGRFVFLFLEGIFGRRVIKEHHEAIVHTLGFVLLIILLLLLTYNDIASLF